MARGARADRRGRRTPPSRAPVWKSAGPGAGAGRPGFPPLPCRAGLGCDSAGTGPGRVARGVTRTRARVAAGEPGAHGPARGVLEVRSSRGCATQPPPLPYGSCATLLPAPLPSRPWPFLLHSFSRGSRATQPPPLPSRPWPFPGIEPGPGVPATPGLTAHGLLEIRSSRGCRSGLYSFSSVALAISGYGTGPRARAVSCGRYGTREAVEAGYRSCFCTLAISRYGTGPGPAGKPRGSRPGPDEGRLPLGLLGAGPDWGSYCAI